MMRLPSFRAFSGVVCLIASSLAAQNGSSVDFAAVPPIAIPNANINWDTLHIDDKTAIWIDSLGQTPNDGVPDKFFEKFAPIFIPKVFDTYRRTYWLRCQVYNASLKDTAHFYVSTGKQYLIEVYKPPDFTHPMARAGNGSTIGLKFMVQDNCLIPMSLAPKETAAAYIKIKTFASLTFSVDPLLINQKASLSAYLPKRAEERFIAYAYAVFLGIIAFLICFTIAQFALNKTKAYLCYIFYLSGVLLTNVRQLEVDLHIPILFSWEPTLLLHGHLPLLVLIQISYVLFIINFLYIKKTKYIFIGF